MAEVEGRDCLFRFRQKPLFRQRLAGSVDAQFLHSRKEGCSFQAKNLSGGALSGNAPSGILQHGHYMRSLHIFEAAGSVRF